MSRRDDTDALADRLARGLEPVRPLLPLGSALAAVVLAGALSVLLLGGPRRLRPDAAQALAALGRFAAVAAGLAALAAGGLAAALAAREPGRPLGLPLAVAVLGAVAGPVALIGAALLGTAPAAEPPLAADLRCALRSAWLALPPGAVAVALLARGAPGRPLASAALAAAGALALGAACQHLACGADGIRHVLVSHALPPVLAGVVLALLGNATRG